MSDNQLFEVIERYLNGDMSQEELARFEMLRNGNTDVNNLVTDHKHFTGLIKQYGERLELERRLDAIHDEIDVHSLVAEMTVHPSWIVQLWRNHHSKISVAASIAIFAVLCTMFFTGYLNNHDSNYIELKGEVKAIKNQIGRSQAAAKSAKAQSKTPNMDSFRGTGFAITSNGLIATNYHVIKDATSVFVQNNDGKAFRATVLYAEPQNDIAILKIADTAFNNLGTIPYTFKRLESDLAESVYTYGYPQDSPTYGYGKLTSSNGLNGDSLNYQISIPVNPGNSGGPLIDSRGNIIGIVQAKETHMEGVHFAVKASYLLDAIQNIPADSLTRKINLNTKNTLSGLTDAQQVKRIKNYVFMVKVYNQ